MEPLFDVNGLMFWNEREIRLRNQFAEHFLNEIYSALLAENPAWRFVQMEGPQLTPRELVNPNYTNDDIWVQENPLDKGLEKEFYTWIESTTVLDIIEHLSKGKFDTPELLESLPDYVSALEKRVIDEGDEYEAHRPWVAQIFELWLDCFDKNPASLVLRPETTPSSYVYARHLLDTHSGVKPPFVVWQTGKSFRREQDQVTKNMRLKEFYQQEFQCVYTTDTKNDYQEAMLEPVRKMIGEMINLPTRLVESDRLPSYSLRTMDVEAWIDDIPSPFSIGTGTEMGRWMEVCSISKRTDFPGKVTFQTKKGTVEKDLVVLEIAIGLDRCVYSFEQKEK